MWQKINQQQKNYLLIAVAILVCYLAYQLSIRRAIAEIVLYRELSQKQHAIGQINGSLGQANTKNDFYAKVVGVYRIRSEDPQGMLWESVSGISHSKGVSIGFNPSTQLLTDSLEIKKNIFRQEFTFRGNYFGLVALVDSISKTQGIGRISSLSIAVAKEMKTEGELELRLSINGIKR